MLESTVTPYAYADISHGLLLFVSLSLARSLILFMDTILRYVLLY